MSDESVIEVSASVPAQAGMPVLPLRDVVVYPHMVIPLFVGREKSIVALDLAMKADKRILLVAQKQADVDDPKGEDLYRVGTVATILQLLKLPDGTVKVLVEGVDRASIEKLIEGEFFSAEAQQEGSPGDPDLAGRHRAGGSLGRHGRSSYVAEALRETESARNS